MQKEVMNREDREVTRAVHRLFWRANWVDPIGFVMAYITRIPAVAAYNVFIPLVSAYAIQAIINEQFDQVSKLSVLVIVLSVAYALLWSTGGLFISRNARRGSEYLQKEVFANFLKKDYDFYTNAYFGSLGAQASRIRDAFNMYGELITLSIPKQVTIIVAGVTVIAWQSWQLALITIATMIAVLGFTIWSGKWRLQFRRRVSSASSVIAAHIGDALTHGTTVKSFAMEQTEERRIEAPLRKWGSEQFKSWAASLPGDNGRMILAAVATALLLIFSAQLYQAGEISITIVILIQLYVVKLVASTLDIAEIIKRYEEAMGAAYEPVKTMLIPAAVNDPAQPKRINMGAEQAICFKNVTFHYPEAAASQHAVKTFSLTITPGQKIGLVGYSGSGKTTLTKLLLRFMDVTSGSITVGGKDVRKLTQQDLRRHIAYVPQEPLLFHRSIYENIAYGKPSASKKAVLKAAQLAHVDEFVRELPAGYDTLVGERGIKLSGGQRQRVAIARALLKDAPILVLDEATSALDSRSEKLIQQALWRLMKNRTALVIAHRLSTIQRMDRIVVMDKGEIVQIGTHNELLKDTKGIYARLWSHQTGGYMGLPARIEKGE